MEPRTISGTEYQALQELQAAELAAEQAVLAVEVARERYWEIAHRETRRERIKDRARTYLHVVPLVGEE